MGRAKGTKKTGGRKKGKKNKKTLEREVFERYLINEIIKERKPLIEALISQGKKGNVKALQQILDRAMGKVKDTLEFEGEKLPFTIKIVVDNGKAKGENS